MHLKDLKQKSPAELVAQAEEMGIEGASTMRKQDLMFSILKIQAENGVEIMGSGTIEVLNDGFGFLRSPEGNYLAGPDDIYVAPSIVRRLSSSTTVASARRQPWSRWPSSRATCQTPPAIASPATKRSTPAKAARSGYAGIGGYATVTPTGHDTPVPPSPQ